MWVLKLNETAQGYFDDVTEAKVHAEKMFGMLEFNTMVGDKYSALIPNRGNTTVTIEFEEDC
jgi:hypothetical protein